MFDRRDEERERRAIRRLVEAASDRDPATEAPPFFGARVRARAATELAHAPAAFGATAWRALPALGVLALALVGASAYESSRLSSDRDAAMARVMSGQGGGDMLVAALLFGADDAASGGSR